MDQQTWRLVGLLLRVVVVVPYIIGVIVLVNEGVTDHRLALIMGVATPAMTMLLGRIGKIEGDEENGNGNGGGKSKETDPDKVRRRIF